MRDFILKSLEFKVIVFRNRSHCFVYLCLEASRCVHPFAEYTGYQIGDLHRVI